MANQRACLLTHDSTLPKYQIICLLHYVYALSIDFLSERTLSRFILVLGAYLGKYTQRCKAEFCMLQLRMIDVCTVFQKLSHFLQYLWFLLTDFNSFTVKKSEMISAHTWSRPKIY